MKHQLDAVQGCQGSESAGTFWHVLAWQDCVV